MVTPLYLALDSVSFIAEVSDVIKYMTVVVWTSKLRKVEVGLRLEHHQTMLLTFHVL
jgi:hypothetical protein